jgi:hypothetical protein
MAKGPAMLAIHLANGRKITLTNPELGGFPCTTFEVKRSKRVLIYSGIPLTSLLFPRDTPNLNSIKVENWHLCAVSMSGGVAVFQMSEILSTSKACGVYLVRNATRLNGCEKTTLQLRSAGDAHSSLQLENVISLNIHRNLE